MEIFINILLIHPIMVIISVSLAETLLNEIDKIKDDFGFSSRSDVLRAAARTLISESREKEELKGSLVSILLLIHSSDVEYIVTDIKHRFEDVINTQLHSHLIENKCLDIFILKGDAEKIKEIVRMFQASNKMDYVKFVLA